MDSLSIQQNQLDFRFQGQTFVLSPLKSVYWKEESTLIISDVHLGKAGHFRKNGIPIPQEVHLSDFSRINYLIETYQPARILFLGDLFHSEFNNEWSDLINWSNQRDSIEQVLVEGNHDQLTRDLYKKTKIHLVPSFERGPFEFTHEKIDSKLHNISGHIHPCVRLQGSARQSITVPCFYFAKEYSLLPAFGTFTGNHPIRVTKGDQIIAIAENQLIDIKP
ncbi:MAG: ligase-associated DNA damage response endonuclease PdeM [Cyclobacteriaceae bacterium]